MNELRNTTLVVGVSLAGVIAVLAGFDLLLTVAVVFGVAFVVSKYGR